MYVKTKYVCEYCGSEYNVPDDATSCEMQCLDMPEKEYFRYITLLRSERRLHQENSVTHNNEVEKKINEITKEIIELQKKYPKTKEIKIWN